MTISPDYRALAKAETTKRLLAQLVNEELVHIELVACSSLPQAWRACITNEGDPARQIRANVVYGVSHTTGLNQPLWRPNDFQAPVVLDSDNVETEEDDPGAIFEFISSWLPCDQGTNEAIALELRNSAAMLEKWMEIAATKPVLDLDASFLHWEQSLISGHPTHPFHRTCFAHKLLKPVGPDDLPEMLNPGLSFVELPRSSVHVFGPFEELTRPLLDQLGVGSSTLREGIIIPCLSQHLPAVMHFFPEANILKSISNCAEAQAAIRTVSVPGYTFDLKFSLACLITSALRVLPCWAAAVAPDMTDILKTVLPADLWVFGEVAAVTGSQEDASKARYLTCILRESESLVARAQENNEAMVLVSALMEKPLGGHQTYAEILFNLKTRAQKMQWFKGYVECLLRLALAPLRDYGIGCEMHAQNTVARICRRTKSIKGFAVRDLAGVKIHRPTLEKRGFDTSNIAPLCTDDLHEVWDRVHHALLQNNIGYMLYALGLEKTDNSWAIIRSVLSDLLESDDNAVGKNIYQYLVRETMPLKCFIRMRIGASFKTSMKLVERNVPGVLSRKAPWLLQISLAGTKDPKFPLTPEQVGFETRTLERKTLERSLLDSVRPYGELPPASRRLNPYPALLPRQFLDNLERFHEALAIAMDNIVERWWKDKEADLPSRMPLEPQVETLLRWVDQATDDGIMPPFVGHQGNLRPDILIPVSSGSGQEIPEFRVCEINARFPISYLNFVACVCEAFARGTWPTPFLEPASTHEKLYDSLFELFNPNVPIHFVQESTDFPQDSPLFGLIEKRTGMRPRTVRPSDLRLVPDTSSGTGYILCCVWGTDPAVQRDFGLMNVAGELLEEVYQVGLQLFDYELFSLCPEMVRHIAKCCVNDPRSVFIAHDKRILGIILQELELLVNKLHILTPQQAQILREHIIPTIVPGSPEFHNLLKHSCNDPHVKDKFILKPIREARGAGVLLGKNLTIAQWESILSSLDNCDFHSSATQYTLQPLLQVRSVDWFWDEQRQSRPSRMVGTYYSVNGRFIGLGMWRAASELEDVISASTKECTRVFSVVSRKA